MTTRKMRMMAASLALVLCVSLYSVPRAKAVATEVAVGTAAVASYFQATGLTMAASAGSTGALITTGVADIAGSYAMATGAASSGSAFLSSVAAGVSISPAGAIVLTAAAVVAIGALVAWYVSENGLNEEAKEAIVFPGTSDFYLYGDVELPDISPFWTDLETYPHVVISTNGAIARLLLFGDGSNSPGLCLYSSSGKYFGVYTKYYEYVPYRIYDISLSSGDVWVAGGQGSAQSPSVLSSLIWWSDPVYYSSDKPVYVSTGEIYTHASDPPVPVGDVSEQLKVTRAPEFTQPDVGLDPDSVSQMIINLGYPAGTTLDTLVEDVPVQIAAGTMTATYEMTEIGEGTDTETDSDEEAGIYIPILSDIKTRLDTLADSISDGIMDGLQSLFVPDEEFFAEAIPALQETFQDRMGLLTFPISLLADFMGRLLDLSDQEPIIRWNSVSIYGHQLIAAGQYNLKDALKSAPVKQMYDIYMITVNAIMIFAFLSLCHNKYRKIMQN